MIDTRFAHNDPLLSKILRDRSKRIRLTLREIHQIRQPILGNIPLLRETMDRVYNDRNIPLLRETMNRMRDRTIRPSRLNGISLN